MIYGYARCSTNESKQNIDRQLRELKTMGATDETIYMEYESGTKVDRIQLERLLNQVTEGDTIVTTEVSRITRSTKQLIDIIELVKDKKLKLVLGGFIVDCTKGQLDAMTQGMLEMMGVFASMERNMISERVKSGMANAKAKGKAIGRATTTVDEVRADKKFMNAYNLYKKGQIKVTDIARICEMSRTTVYKYIGLIEG